ncbi:MAG TPA: Hsp20/alpha crystallin family protein [Terriglobales bacterium]|nr:Hsp20/alpha crystallin family protein [Terriglobales bacterium]
MSSMITRWDPFRELSSLQERVNRLFQETGGRQESLTTGSFVPAVDIYEDDHNIKLKMEVPGIDQKDLDIQVENNTLTVKGQRKFEKEEKEENFHRIERHYGSFYRSFALPNAVDTDKVSADYQNGVLNIVLPKRAEATPKQVKVNVTAHKEVESKSPGKAA